jgi:hypothetical protein
MQFLLPPHTPHILSLVLFSISSLSLSLSSLSSLSLSLSENPGIMEIGRGGLAVG